MRVWRITSDDVYTRWSFFIEYARGGYWRMVWDDRVRYHIWSAFMGNIPYVRAFKVCRHRSIIEPYPYLVSVIIT